MCGLAGVLNLYETEPVEYDTMRRMLSQLHHRGPDEGGIYVDGRIGLSHARLSIIDLAGGKQPISNEDGTKWIVYNGEVFNYEALRPALMARSHQFTTQTDSDYSHQLRWQNTNRAKRFFSDELQASLPPAEPLSLPFGFERWHPLHRAQYLEATIFLPQYLLSSQGDRMSMAHAVEGRYPFLDHRLIEFCNHLPPTMKLFGLQENFLLKKLGQRYLPDEIWRRPKRPYRAPIHNCFFSPQPPNYVRELLSPAYVRKVGLFKETAVIRLVQKIERGLPISETDDMALAGILSTQLIYHLFIDNYRLPAANPAQNNLKYFGIKEPV